MNSVCRTDADGAVEPSKINSCYLHFQVHVTRCHVFVIQIWFLATQTETDVIQWASGWETWKNVCYSS